MVKVSILKNASTLRSPLSEASLLEPDQHKGKKGLEAPLLLTSLIDTFAILVIYLLANFSTSGEILYLSKGMELPAAKNLVPIERNVIIKFDSNKYYLEDREVALLDLTPKLLEIRKLAMQMAGGAEFKGALTVQADRRAKFEILSPIVQAAGQAGFEEVRFAILPK